MGFQAVDEFHDAVMLQCEPVREIADRGLLAFRNPANHEKQQILLRLEACGTRHGIAFADKFANAVAQLGQRLVLRGGDLFCHAVSISYYDIYERLQPRRWFRKVIMINFWELTAACERTFASCNARSRYVRKTGGRARGSHSNGRTCSCSRVCGPNPRRRRATARLRRDCDALPRQLSRSLPRGPRLPATVPC